MNVICYFLLIFSPHNIFYELYMPKYRSAFNHIYHLLVLVMPTITKNALAAMFIITLSASLIQSGLFSSFSHHSSTFPITNDVYASKKKDTNTYDSLSAMPQNRK